MLMYFLIHGLNEMLDLLLKDTCAGETSEMTEINECYKAN